MNLAYLILLCFFIFCGKATFNIADHISEIIIGPSTHSPSGYDCKYSDLIAFQDGKFNILYPHSTQALYGTFVQNGQRKYTPYQLQHDPRYNVKSVSGINVNERVIFSYTLDDWTGLRQQTDIGTGVSNTTFPYAIVPFLGGSNEKMVVLEDDSNFGVCYSYKDAGAQKSNIYCRKYTYNASNGQQTMNLLGIAHSYTDQEQFLWDFVKVDTNRNILMTFSNGPDNPDFTTDGTLLYFLELSDDTSTWTNNVMTVIPGTKNYKYPTLQPTGNGGFVLMAVDTDNNQIKCMGFDNTNTISVAEQTVYEFGKTVDFVIHQNTAYVVIVSSKTGEENYLIGIEVDITTCQRSRDREIIVNEEIENHPTIALNSDDGYTFMGIGYNVKTATTTYEYRVSEYMIDTAGAAACSTGRCSGCFNTFTCPVCIGSDADNRIIRYKSEGDCTCIDGYYDDYPTNNDCQKCDDTVCGTCNTSATNCDVFCQDECAQCETTGACKGPNCAPGYFNQAGPPVTCTRCNIKCLNCTGDINTCDGCADSTRDNTQNCKCNVGKYSLIVDETCDQNCGYKCLNCAEVTGTCIDCADSNRDPLDSCNCVDGYYEDGVNNTTCGKCDDSLCGTCHTNATTCNIFCREGCARCDSNGNCVGPTCKTGYRFDSGTNTCQKCNVKCLNCSGDNDTCVGCANDTRDDTQNCQCKDGFYEIGSNNASCGTCNHFLCATCSGTAHTCTLSCEAGCRRCNASNICQEFIPGYFKDSSGNLQTCDQNCLKCENQVDECTGCRIGLYLENQECKKCSEKCASCTDFDTCEICAVGGVGRSLDINSNCNCIEGYYSDSNSLDCVQCNSRCKSCENGTECTECINSSFILPQCEISNEGFFVVEQDGNQVPALCAVKCEKCGVSSDDCTVCTKGLHRDRNLPCNCEEGYHDEDGLSFDCQKCPKFCKKCQNSGKCLECDQEKQFRKLSSFSGLCECMKGYKEKKGECIRCYDYKGSCLFKCPSNSYKDENKFMCLSQQQQALYNQEIYYICGFCIILLMVTSGIFGVYLVSRKKIDESPVEVQVGDQEQKSQQTEQSQLSEKQEEKKQQEKKQEEN